LEQIQHVKERYLKLNQATQKSDHSKKEAARMKLDKEMTERLIKHAIGSQVEQDRLAREDE